MRRPRWSAAFHLHNQVKDRIEQIDKVIITTQESAIRIIDKSGPLHNPADRDHCIQYMTAVGLIFGELTADHYEDTIARDPRIDALRAKMICVEDPQYSKDYLDPRKALHRQRRSSLFQRWVEHRESCRRISDRPPPPPRRGHAAAGEKIRDQSGVALRAGRSATRLCAFVRMPKTLDATPVDEFTDMFVKAV